VGVVWDFRITFAAFHRLTFWLNIAIPLAPTAVCSSAHKKASVAIWDSLPVPIKLLQFLEMTAKSSACVVFSKATSAFRALFVC
jgi:hypothetical protein